MSTRYIVGLGNPGEEYNSSRHNAGFYVVDMLAKKLDMQWKFEKKFNAEVARQAGGVVVLVKPMTFMNESGSAVRSVLAFFKDKSLQGDGKEMRNLVIVYDDLDLELGQHKRQYATHPKIHNGVNSIISSLGSEKFWNVRIGTDTRSGERNLSGKDFVLKPLTAEESARLAVTVGNVVQELHDSIVSS